MAYGRNQKKEKNPDKIGALWVATDKDTGKKRTDANGNGMLSGNIEIDGEVVKITVIKNGYKEEPKHPDFVIFKAKEMDGGGTKRRQDDDDTPF